MAEIVHIRQQGRRSYEELFEEAMKEWRKYSEEYRTIKDTYKEKKEEKKALKLKPLQPISARIMSQFPKIAFLKIEDEKEAEDYLLGLTDREVKKLLTEIQIWIDGAPRNTLLDRIALYNDQIRRFKSLGKKSKSYL